MNSSTSLSSTTLAAVFHGPDEPLELDQLPTPEPQAGEALVRIECCTICGSDLHTVAGKRKEPTPTILGHEIIGVVEAVGSPRMCDLEGTELTPGERVTWSVAVSCGACDRCRQGLPQKCRSLTKYGHELCEGHGALSGGLAERILLRPGTAVVKLPFDLPAEVICPVSCATATVAAAYRVSRSVEGRTVLILGAGMLGLTAAAMAETMNAERVIVCDVDPARLSQVKQFGADDTVEWVANSDQLRERLQQASGRDSFDLILELSGSPDAVDAAIQLAGVGGEVVLVGSVMKSQSVSIDPESVVRRCLSMHGVHNYAPEDLRTAVKFLIANHSHYPFAELVRDSYQLADINLAIETALQERPVRVAIRP